jgi:hypothetical protein
MHFEIQRTAVEENCRNKFEAQKIIFLKAVGYVPL